MYSPFLTSSGTDGRPLCLGSYLLRRWRPCLRRCGRLLPLRDLVCVRACRLLRRCRRDLALELGPNKLSEDEAEESEADERKPLVDTGESERPRRRLLYCLSSDEDLGRSGVRWPRERVCFFPSTGKSSASMRCPISTTAVDGCGGESETGAAMGVSVCNKSVGSEQVYQQRFQHTFNFISLYVTANVLEERSKLMRTLQSPTFHDLLNPSRKFNSGISVYRRTTVRE